MNWLLPAQGVTSSLFWQQYKLNMAADMIFITLPFASSYSGYERIGFVYGMMGKYVLGTTSFWNKNVDNYSVITD